MAMDEERLGHRLQAARLAAGLTQQSLCHKAGLSYSTLTKIERGAIKSPSVFTIQSITGALGISLDELVGTGNTKQQAKRRSKSGVSFVYFDINGCLVRFFHRAFTRLAEDTDAPADIIETTFWHYNDEVCNGDMSLDDFNRAYAKALGVERLNWEQYYLEAIEPIKDMHPLLEWVSQHYRVGLLTNIMPGFIDAMLAKKLLPAVQYDAIIDSSKVKAVKPEAKIYELATERAGCPPSEILLVDDGRPNLMAAEKQGWHVLWFDDYRPEESIKRIKASLEPAE
jgi:FMN phosphatase YigB (HAD superfamily)/DNA-binding XRE family transcriptional regulator